jgi:hypothetical protein
MNHKLCRSLMLPLLLGSALTFSSKATAYPGPNLCPVAKGEGEVGTSLTLYAETSDRYVNICEDSENPKYYYVSRLKSGGNTVQILVNQSNTGWNRKSKNEYQYVVSPECRPKVRIYPYLKEERLFYAKNFLPTINLTKGRTKVHPVD